ncbi:MAG: response regulator [Dehalococcoidia bacterium]|jgi:CheY-like chemotaxis protein|nr:response regulator [Dehalococcoidia bacterium]
MEKEGTGKKVLVVDDKEENRRLLRKILALHGYSVVETATGEAAIELAQTERPDVILMDLRLREGIDGIETTRRLKTLPAVAQIPVIAITASVSPEDMQRALDSGCSDFIRKPIDIDEFPRQVARHIGQGS